MSSLSPIVQPLPSAGIRAFLRQRGAVLVHFSTVMASHDYVFPDDILNAASLSGAPLSFSTILCGDTGPFGAKGGGEGSVGLLVDIGPDTVVQSVRHQDAGANEHGAFGSAPSEQGCADSIDKRERSNEWRVRDYAPVGIFILPPIYVRKMTDDIGGPSLVEHLVNLEEAIAAFGSQRVFSANARTFLEFERAANAWRAVSYDDMIAARW